MLWFFKFQENFETLGRSSRRLTSILNLLNFIVDLLTVLICCARKCKLIHENKIKKSFTQVLKQRK